MLDQYEISVAYSMVVLAQQSSKVAPQPFQEFMCYWTAFNNIYTTIAESKGYFARLCTQKDGTIRRRENGSVLILEVEMSLRERDEIDLVYNEEFSEGLKHKLIDHPNTKFFVERIPKWHGLEIKFDEHGQRTNGVINVRYTIDDKHPVWSPIDLGAYERYTQGKAESDDVNLLARQLLFLIYTVRNNTFHGGKRADDANDRQVIEKALPLLKMIVESFMLNSGRKQRRTIMPKATFSLPNGTIVTIEGESGEIQALLDHYSTSNPFITSPRKKKESKSESSQAQSSAGQVDFSMIVNLVKNCDEAEAIERQILDKASQVNRTLLPLYIVHEHMDNAVALTSGDINKITTDLGIPIATPNASRTLSGTASRYVIGDQVRTKGQPVRYTLSRRGVQYIKSVITGVEDDNKE